MAEYGMTLSALERARRDQLPQAFARLVVVGLFVLLWGVLWLLRIPMPVPFLLTLLCEAAFFCAYLPALRVWKSEPAIQRAFYVMLAAEIVFHTTMVYFLGGITWLGAFAYMFGLIFTNMFLDLRRGLIYTSASAAAFVSLILWDATGVIPHYSYLELGADRYADPRFVATSILGAVGVFFSTYAWVNWVGHEMRRERDNALAIHDELIQARYELEVANAGLEIRVQRRTGELEMAVAALRDGEALLRSTLESTADGILVVDADGKVAHANGRFARMWHIPSELLDMRDDDRLLAYVIDQLEDANAFVGKVRELYQSPDESFDALRFKDGRVFERYSRPLMNEGRIEGRVWSFRDVSERKRFEDQLVDLANHDPLTGLFNRRRFNEEIERQLSTARRYNIPGALLFLDLDQFKDVNDSRGHRAGDELLIELARLLGERLRDADIVARLGGDEFAILLPHTNALQASIVATAILEAIRAHTFKIVGSPVGITASIGVALFPEQAGTAGELLSCADLAMYEAKEQGRNRVSVFAQALDWQARIESRIGWQQRIREALEQDRFVLHAQPILDLTTGSVSQYELLIRAAEVDGELILPGVFLGVAERSGLIQDIDRWVVKKAIAMIAERESIGEKLRLEVNLSGKAFADQDLLSVIQKEIARTGIDPSCLVLEVTETAAIANLDDAQRFVETLRMAGCSFALDDFGVGFSSFAHLKYLPVDYLKIDGSFIRDLPRSTVDQHLVRAIVDVARSLGKKTIAEFVEDADTLALLREFGVDFAQGFFVGRPAPLPRPDTTTKAVA
ncbi:MAG: EAL domain-containing protein [Chloroflexi bacterium]|nr:EAL domain-containing protein [Chloroflexota bacterium]